MTRSEELTLKLIDGEISEEELNELEWLVATDNDAAEAHVSLLELEGLLRGRTKMPDQSAAIMNAVLAQADQRRAATPPAGAELESLQSGVRDSVAVNQSVADERPVDERRVHKRGRRKHRGAPIALYIAATVALIAVVVGVVVINTHSGEAADPGSWARLVNNQGQVQLLRGEKRYGVKATSKLKPGEGIDAGLNSRVYLYYPDETILLVNSETTVTVDGDPTVDRPNLRQFQLTRGSVKLTKSADPSSVVVAVQTPHAAVIADAGAVVDIVTTDQRTRVDVTTGSVKVNSRFDTARRIDINAGEFTISERGLPLVAKPVGAIERTEQGLIALYRFETGSGAEVRDINRTGAPLNLAIANEQAVTWGNRKLTLAQPCVIHSPGPATKVYNALLNTSAVTVEAWLQPAEPDNADPAVIFAIADNATFRNLQIEQQAGKLRALLRTTQSPNADRAIETAPGVVTGELMHVVYVRGGAGQAKLYVNGSIVAADTQPGALDNWARDFPLALGNVPSGDRPWLGDLRLVAVYDRELTVPQIRNNFNVGITDDFAAPPPPTDPDTPDANTPPTRPGAGPAKLAANTPVVVDANGQNAYAGEVMNNIKVFTELKLAGDPQATRFEMDQRVVQVTPGTTGKLIEYDEHGVWARVELLDGDHAGRKLWFTPQHLRPR